MNDEEVSKAASGEEGVTIPLNGVAATCLDCGKTATADISEEG